jgi:hypothetical protein
MTSQTVRSGTPSLQSVTRGRAHSSMIGPVVPSETCRRDQREAGRRAAQAATGHGAVSGATTTRFARTAPFYLSTCSAVRGAWSPQRVSAGIATHVVTPTPASTASRKAGLLP